MKTNTMMKNKGTEFLFDALLAAAKKRQHEPVPVPSILADAMQIAAEEIDRLHDELESARRHMELAENAWLRETAGNTPKPHTTPDECSVPDGCTLTDEECAAIHFFSTARDGAAGKRHAATFRKLLKRLK